MCVCVCISKNVWRMCAPCVTFVVQTRRVVPHSLPQSHAARQHATTQAATYYTRMHTHTHTLDLSEKLMYTQTLNTVSFRGNGWGWLYATHRRQTGFSLSLCVCRVLGHAAPSACKVNAVFQLDRAHACDARAYAHNEAARPRT